MILTFFILFSSFPRFFLDFASADSSESSYGAPTDGGKTANLFNLNMDSADIGEVREKEFGNSH